MMTNWQDTIALVLYKTAKVIGNVQLTIDIYGNVLLNTHMSTRLSW